MVTTKHRYLHDVPFAFYKCRRFLMKGRLSGFPIGEVQISSVCWAFAEKRAVQLLNRKQCLWVSRFEGFLGIRNFQSWIWEVRGRLKSDKPQFLHHIEDQGFWHRGGVEHWRLSTMSWDIAHFQARDPSNIKCIK